MTQRSANNERYLDENRGGKTRKSAASAKPAATRAATVRDPAPKSKKQKKAEAREREREQDKHWTQVSPDNKALEDMPEYKRYRKMWWVCLICAIVLIVATFLFGSMEQFKFLYIPCIVLGYILVIVAFYIDFGLIRKMRKRYQKEVAQGKSKEARAAQKAARAEARAQQKEAEEKFAAAQAEEAEKKANSPLTRISNKLFGSKEPEAESSDEK